MRILGISCFYHDAAAAILQDGTIMAAAQEERFTRKKHDETFPRNALRYCLQEAGCSLAEIDAVVFYDKPFLKFERLLETYYRHAPRGFLSFVKAMPVWLREKLFIKDVVKKELQEIDPSFSTRRTKLLFTEHHLSHAASAFFASGLDEAAILTIDGVGEWATASICIGKGNGIRVLKELRFPDSVGLLYSSFTAFLGFRVNSGEYKLMGLAPYGDETAAQTKFFIDAIEKEMVTVYEDGSIALNQACFSYSTGLRMFKEERWSSLFGLSPKKESEPFTTAHCNLAFAAQHVTEKIVRRMAAHTAALTQQSNLCLAGGVALNCVANGKLQQSGLFRNIFIQPAAGDAGGALGAALSAYHIYYQQPRILPGDGKDGMQNTYLGPGWTDTAILQCMRRFNAEAEQHATSGALTGIVAKELLAGKVIGWFQGRMEFGPRALGNRSILASPLPGDMQQKINLKIKFREGFRPFAPVTTEEDYQHYFDTDKPSRYMLITAPLKERWRLPLLSHFNQLSPEEKRNQVLSLLPAITHVDYSCRVQTVAQPDNPLLWQLLQDWKAVSGHPVLVNTSFNVRGEPIVNTPEEAYRCFMQTGMDMLVMNGFIFYKERQPALAVAEQPEAFAAD